MKAYLPDILLNPALSNWYMTKGVSVSGSSGASPLLVPIEYQGTPATAMATATALAPVLTEPTAPQP